MRTLLAALVLLMAGCLAQDNATQEPTGDQLPDGSGGEDDTPDGGPGSGGSGGFAPQEGHDEASDPDVPGVVVEGDLIPCEAGFCIDAEARNEGEATYHVSSICVPPWSERIEQAGGRIQHREPMAHCLAFGTSPFGPGEREPQTFAWNGTVWDDEAQAYEPAPGGAYQWIVSFEVFEEAGGAGRHTLEIAFTVVVGQT